MVRRWTRSNDLNRIHDLHAWSAHVVSRRSRRGGLGELRHSNEATHAPSGHSPLFAAIFMVMPMCLLDLVARHPGPSQSAKREVRCLKPALALIDPRRVVHAARAPLARSQDYQGARGRVARRARGRAADCLAHRRQRQRAPRSAHLSSRRRGAGRPAAGDCQSEPRYRWQERSPCRQHRERAEAHSEWG